MIRNATGHRPTQIARRLLPHAEAIEAAAGAIAVEADVAIRIAEQIDDDRLFCRRLTTAQMVNLSD